MSTHEFIVEPERKDFDEHPGAGLIRIVDPTGRSFALPFAADAERAGKLTLRVGIHALCARQLYALAALLDNQEETLSRGSN